MELGRYAVPGPLAETVAALLLGERTDLAKRFLPGTVSGWTMATVTTAEYGYALDGGAAEVRLAATPDGLRLSPGAGAARRSLDPARRRTPLLARGQEAEIT